MDFEEILTFWFTEIPPSAWWKKDTGFDDEVRKRFLSIHQQAAACELFEWRKSPRGSLAEVIILDQFSRNLFRDRPEAFAQDALALALAQEAIAQAKHIELNLAERCFLYMPYMHSESLAIHNIALGLFDEKGLESNLEFEIKHRNIIKSFGRYPYRNAILGRSSTDEEIEFLKQPGSSF